MAAGPTFVDWLKTPILPSHPPEHLPDGYKSHICYEACLLAHENGVHLLKLPPHLTHLLQPLDLAVFKPMKCAWDVAAADFVRREWQAITRQDFPSLLSVIWRKGYKPGNATGGF